MPKGSVVIASSRCQLKAVRVTRVHLGLIVLAAISVWLVIVFARSLGELDRARARQNQIAGESDALTARLAADKREYALVQTDAFQALQARAYGIGGPGEQVFSLAAGAPSPPPIAPLGRSTTARVPAPTTPLDAWLEILFGS